MQEILDKQIKACIHCGMCLPACPTYQSTGNEGNSPRGRIYLIRDMLDESIDDKQDKAIEYLDNCLSCFACETVCPSDVEYGSILDFARKDLTKTNYNQGFLAEIRRFVFKNILVSRKSLLLIKNLLKNFSWLNDIFAIFNKNLSYINALSHSFQNPYEKIETDFIYYSGATFMTGRTFEERLVSLPLGCVMDTLYNEVHHHSIYVLNQFGYHVYVPPSNCCGALAEHSGEEEIAYKQLQESIDIFTEKRAPVVFNSAGCGAFVKEHAQSLLDLSLEAELDEPKDVKKDFFKEMQKSKTLSVFDFIEMLESAPIDAFEKKALKSTRTEEMLITYHPACHINHRQGVSDLYLKYLKKIPYLKIKELPDADTCCGSAGLYNIIKPELAYDIGEIKANNIESTGVSIIVSANPGCMSQIKAHLGEGYEVVHPISVIAEYLGY